MSEWWIVQNTSVTPNTYTVVEKNPPAPAGSNGIGYFNESNAKSTAAALNASAKEGVAKTLETKIPGVSALTSVTQFLGNLANANLWMRVGEVVLGLILIAVGVAELTHAVPIATKIAKTAAGAAVVAA
jgi:hypothetical protein